MYNDDDELVLSDGVHKLTIGTERYDPLGLTLGYVDRDGTARALSILAEAIDPPAFDSIRSEIKAYSEQHDLKTKTIEEVLADGSMLGFLALLASRYFEFVVSHKETIFDMSPTTKYAYDNKQREIYSRLGLKSIPLNLKS